MTSAQRKALFSDLRKIVGDPFVLVEKEDVIVYEQDGSVLRVMPEIVVLPADTAQVSAVVRAARQANVPIVPRGSGTGLAGGAVPAEGGIVLCLARLNRILKIDLQNRVAVVKPGVINLDLTKAITKDGFFYAPDPSSQAACSIGGNVANNSGGPHTLAYGVTTNHVLDCSVVRCYAKACIFWLRPVAAFRFLLPLREKARMRGDPALTLTFILSHQGRGQEGRIHSPQGS